MNTVKLKLPFLEQSQAQKEVTVNEGIQLLDFYCQATVKAKTKKPPTNKNEGDTYLIEIGSGGDFANKDNNIAVYTNGTFKYLEPFEGLRIYILDEDKEYIYKNDGWRENPIYTRLSDLEKSLSEHIKKS